MERPNNDGPSVGAWSLALISLALPWIGTALAFYGGLLLIRGSSDGWPYLIAGLLAFIVDIVIDFLWAQPSVLRSDDPVLNARAARLAGRNCVVVEPIRDGRGRVRIDDTEWVAEGRDAAIGSLVRVAGNRGTVLKVEVAPNSKPTP